jgi:peroxiredoxin
LRQVPDADRGKVTTQIALDIRALPPGTHKTLLANGLANLSTEGDFGHDTLQTVADTLAGSLKETPEAPVKGEIPSAYLELAQLAAYEHVSVSLEDAQYVAAVAQVKATDKVRAHADFTLDDLSGQPWTLSALKGKTVLVNFWATWCPPCRKEMPDLQQLSTEFRDRGLVVIGISDEPATKVQPFVTQHAYTYTMLLDPGRSVNDLYKIDGIPKTFLYDRRGRLVGQAMDMRTRGQLLQLLKKAGIGG